MNEPLNYRRKIAPSDAVAAHLVRSCVSNEIPFTAKPLLHPPGSWDIAAAEGDYGTIDRLYSLAVKAADVEQGKFLLSFEAAVKRLFRQGPEDPLAAEDFFRSHPGLRDVMWAAAQAAYGAHDRYSAEQAAAIWFRETVEPVLGQQARRPGPEDRVLPRSPVPSTASEPDAPQGPAGLLVEALGRVAEVIEATYDHDEQGHRTIEAGQLSGADVIEALCFHEELVFKALEVAKGLAQQSAASHK